MVDDLLERFQQEHSFRIPEFWCRGRSLLATFLNGRQAGVSCLGKLDESVLKAEPSLGLLYQLSERAFEHVAASFVCFSCGYASTAELAARTALESSINIRYILADDRNSRTLAWLREFVQQDAHQIGRWEREVSSYSEADKALHIGRLSTRKEINESRVGLVKRLEQEFGAVVSVDLDLRWPSRISERFDAVGESLGYRTAYARLSSQVHGDAEDTLNYMVGKLCDDQQLFECMAMETIGYSEFLVFYGLRAYLLALGELCRTFAGAAPAIVANGVTGASDAMEDIGKQWRW